MPAAPNSANRHLQELIARLNEAEASLQDYLGGQGDVVIDPLNGVPVLLRAAQQALLESEAHYRRQADILEQVRNSIIVTDIDGRVTYWNAGASEIYGYPEADMLGQSVARLYVNPAAFEEHVARTRAGALFHLEWEGAPQRRQHHLGGRALQPDAGCGRRGGGCHSGGHGYLGAPPGGCRPGA